MLRIRKQQIEPFEARMARSFEDRMLVHIERFFPEHHEALGEKNARELVQTGIERARRYGIVSERDVCLYVDLMLAFGPEFDEDPDCSWAPPILADEDLGGPGARIDALYEAGMGQLRSSPDFTAGNA